MSEPNVQLFVDVLAQIEREPQTWDQRKWGFESDCGTAFCFAGHAVALSGRKWGRYSVDGVVHSPECFAAILLGIQSAGHKSLLTCFDANVELFGASNTLDDLYRISADILGLDETVLREKVAAEVGSAVAS